MKRTLLVGVLAWAHRTIRSSGAVHSRGEVADTRSFVTGETVDYIGPGPKRGAAIVEKDHEHYLIPESFLSAIKEK